MNERSKNNNEFEQDDPIDEFRPNRARDPDLDPPETIEERKARFLDALFKTLGCALAACQKTGIARDEWEAWLEEDDEFAKKIAGIREDALDYVEGKMFEEIKAGNPQLIKFFLENKGRNRGYGKKQRQDRSEEETPFAVLSEDEMAY